MLHLLLAIYLFKTILGVSEPFSNAPPKKYFCTDTTQSVIPLKILRPDQEIELLTPDFPFPFKNSRLNCVWKIQGLHGTRVQLRLVHKTLDEACNDNILTVQDDSPRGSGSELAAPGRSASCGQSTFPAANIPLTSDGVVTVWFRAFKNYGKSRFRMVVTGALPEACPAKYPSGCPNGPCCTGDDCCVINAGEHPLEIQSPGFPAPSAPGLRCQYKMVTSKGAQISINFLSMDIRTDSGEACLADFITLEDPSATSSSMIGKGKTFCGQKLPNYPGPSILVSSGNSLILKYRTDLSTSLKGSGFKATVSAINPTCNRMSYEYQYGTQTCNSTCGSPYTFITTTSPTPPKTTTVSTTSTTSHLVNTTCEKIGVGYVGTPVGVIKNIDTWEKCAHQCWLKVDVCSYFSWNQSGTCTLFGPDAQEKKDSNSISGTGKCGEVATTTPSTITTTTTHLANVTCEKVGVLYEGNKVEETENVTSWMNCASKCWLKKEECSFFTWNHKKMTCTLLGSKAEEKESIESVSGTADCGKSATTTAAPPTTTPKPTGSTTTTVPHLINETCVEKDVYYNYVADEELFKDVPSWEACAYKCHESPKCKGWVWAGPDFREATVIGWCRLLPVLIVGKEPLKGLYRGTKDCGEPETTTTTTPPTTTVPLENSTCGLKDTYHKGSPIISYSNVPSWQECARRCKDKREDGCLYWSYFTLNYFWQHLRGRCDLQSTDEGFGNEPHIYSGDVDCGTPGTTTLAPTTIPPAQNETCEDFNEAVVGTPIKLIHNVDSYQQCAYLCYQDNKCQVWSWISTGFSLKSAVGDCDLKEKDDGRRKVIGAVSGTSDCGKPEIKTTTTPAPTTTSPLTEIITTQPEKCSEILELFIYVFDGESGDPLPRAKILIQTKQILLNQDIPKLFAKHVTDANGKVVEEGKVGGTYNIYIEDEYEKFIKELDWKINAVDVSCTNENCTRCEESIRIRSPVIPVAENCTCESEVTILNELTQLPIPDACVSVSFENKSTSTANSRMDLLEYDTDDSLSSEHETNETDESYDVEDRKANQVRNRQNTVFNQNTCLKKNMVSWASQFDRIVGIKSWEECASKCRDDEKCFSFSFFRTVCVLNFVPVKEEELRVLNGAFFGTRDCGMCQLRTDFRGRVEIPTPNVGSYLLTVSHPDYKTNKFNPMVEEPLLDGDCEYCNLKIKFNMTTKFCDLEKTPANLKVTVTNEDTEEYIQGAEVYLEVIGFTKESDKNGSATFSIKQNGIYRVVAKATGMNEAFATVYVFCYSGSCETCKPSVEISMKPVIDESTIPPTEAPCNKPVKNQIIIVAKDSDTLTEIEKVVYTLSVNDRVVAKDFIVLGSSQRALDKILFEIEENGRYSVEASAEGYKNSTVTVPINCTNENCQDCLHTITLELQPDVCNETDFTLTVKDANSNAPIEGAIVKIEDVNRVKRLGRDLITDENGMVVVISSGKASLYVEVIKEGYTFANGTTNFECSHPCSSCNPQMIMKITEKSCKDVNVEFEISVEDETGIPLSGALIRMQMTSSLAGPSAGLSRDETLRTDQHGITATPVYATGTYRLSVSADGFISVVEEILIDKKTRCVPGKIPVKFYLQREKVKPHCENGTILVTVLEKVTDQPMLGAAVTISKGQQFIAKEVLTNQLGMVKIPATEDGSYSVEVTKEGHKVGKVTASLRYPHFCLSRNKLWLEEKTCPKTIMPVRVTDNITDAAVPNALVKVILVKSSRGPENSELDEPKYTDDNGTAYFNVPMNGVYRVQVTVDGYDQVEVPKDVHCNVDHCEGCAPNVVVVVNPSFCPKKFLKLRIIDCLSNALITGAEVETSLNIADSVVKTVKVESTISADSGEVVIPLSENGIYNSLIRVDGYDTIENSFEVNVDKDKCEEFNPVDTVPICPPEKPGCTSVTLAWANDKDIDLIGVRVNKTNTNDTCTTKPSCCDGCKKEDCDGVTPSIDDEDGLNGTETITYCNTSDYSNMLYISDPNGEGKFLPKSGAKLVITLGKKQQVIRIDEVSKPEGAKYWLAGCLTTQDTSFKFITINKFYQEEPDKEDSLLCYDRVKEDDQSNMNANLRNAQLEVNFYDADTNQPIIGAMAQASSRTKSISRLSKDNGKSTIIIRQNGEYVVDATADGYLAAENAVTIECQENGNDVCTETVAFSLVPEGRRNEVEIVLNWGNQADNLDLHTIQVHQDVTALWCETYFGKKFGCPSTRLDRDIKNGGAYGGEKITISTFDNLPYTYMIVVKDNSRFRNQLDKAEGSIHISDGSRSLSRSLPSFESDTPEGAYYWFVGCLNIVDRSFVFSAVDKLAKENPYVTERLYCDELFKKNPNAGIASVDQFCTGVSLDLTFVVHGGGDQAEISIISVDFYGEEKIIMEESIRPRSINSLKTPISTNGKYIVKVGGEGYTTTEQEYLVNCKTLDCKYCNPSFTVPIIGTPERDDQVKIALSWNGPRNALLSKSAVVDSSSVKEECYSLRQNKSTCFTLKPFYGDNYIQFEEFSKVLSGKAGTLLVRLSDAVDSVKPGARVTVADATRTVTAMIDMEDYQGEDYWLPFCIFSDGTTFRLFGGPVYFNRGSWDTYAEKYCARGFGFDV